ncbi:hypothetical protein BH09PAT1_BH09PAT1_7830 [soil metagenome]
MIVLLIVFVINIFTFIKALRASKNKKTILAKPYKICEPFGSFVWADHVLFGPFWIFVSLVTLILHDVILFFLIFAIFWVVRSGGETLYWFFQQFHPRIGNEPDKFWINKIVPGEAVWFMHQIFWQCITVISIILSLYLSFLWIKTF